MDEAEDYVCGNDGTYANTKLGSAINCSYPEETDVQTTPVFSPTFFSHRAVLTQRAPRPGRGRKRPGRIPDRFSPLSARAGSVRCPVLTRAVQYASRTKRPLKTCFCR
eukprot:879932-Rhodomonas_salina.2